MPALPPWARGPFELIQHAEGHYHSASDFDRRIALISFDNAIEAAITTFLQLHPRQRNGRSFARADVENWLRNYHTKLEFLEQFTDQNATPLETSTAEIIWYHSIRNELYHSGNGMVPPANFLDGVRAAALEVFQVLFAIDTAALLASSEPAPPPARDRGDETSPQTLFLKAFIEFERALKASALALGLQYDGRAEGVGRLWAQFESHAGGRTSMFSTVVQRAHLIRNSLVHKGAADATASEFQRMALRLMEVVDFLESFGFSLDIALTLRKRYGDWVRSEISSVRVLHKDGSAFLEVNYSSSGLYDEESKRVNLDFISSGSGPLFLPTRRAQENADRFFDQLDLYSILMTGIGELLFTREGTQAAARHSGADRGISSRRITRRN